MKLGDCSYETACKCWLGPVTEYSEHDRYECDHVLHAHHHVTGVNMNNTEKVKNAQAPSVYNKIFCLLSFAGILSP